jgi:hypothetical protein
MPGTTLATDTDMRAITGGLAAAGMQARLETGCPARYIVATVPAAGEGAVAEGIEVTVEDDGYVQLTWWNRPPLTPAGVTATIARVIAALTGQAPGPATGAR